MATWLLNAWDSLSEELVFRSFKHCGNCTHTSSEIIGMRLDVNGSDNTAYQNDERKLDDSDNELDFEQISPL